MDMIAQVWCLVKGLFDWNVADFGSGFAISGEGVFARMWGKGWLPDALSAILFGRLLLW